MIVDLIKTKLGIPVQEDLSVALMPKCATIDLYYVGYGLAGDGEQSEEIYSYSVMLHYKESSREDIFADAKTLRDEIMNACVSSIPTIDITYDTMSHYWQTTINFQTTSEV